MSENSAEQNVPQLQCQLTTDDATGNAAFELTPGANTAPLTKSVLMERLSQANMSNWEIDDNALNDVIKKFSNNTPCTIAIARKLDAQAKITISEDAMSVHITAIPAKGGDPLTPNAILALLNEHKISSKRISQANISHLCQSSSNPMPNSAISAEVLVASGQPAVPGQDSRFENLIDKEDSSEEPKVTDDGKVDHLAGKVYLSVEAGTGLLKRIPPTSGSVGMDVYGQITSAAAGKEIDFGTNIDGCQFAINDSNLLEASVSGHPVFQDDCVRVDESLILDSVNLTTGHVEFDGSVFVKGDVMPDMKIKATGDIFVKGVVERADIESGNNITVGGGVLGGNSPQEPSKEIVDIPDDNDDEDSEQDAQLFSEPELPEYECHISAQGIVSAKYVNFASVKAGKEIQIKEYSFNSFLKAGSRILLGQKGGKGNIVGGQAVAGHSIVANKLGNKAYLHTHFRIGMSVDELVEFRKFKQQRDLLIEEGRKSRTALLQLKEQSKQQTLETDELERASSLHEFLLKLQVDMKELDINLRQLKNIGASSSAPNICAMKFCYPNCFIALKGAYLHTKQEHKTIQFIKLGNRISAKK